MPHRIPILLAALTLPIAAVAAPPENPHEVRDPVGFRNEIEVHEIGTGRTWREPANPDVVDALERFREGAPGVDLPAGAPPAGLDRRSGLLNFGGHQLVSDPTRVPYRKHVKIKTWYSDASGNVYQTSCSGTLIDPEIVLTAGHCIYMHEDVHDHADSVKIFPGYDNGQPSRYGVARGVTLSTYTGWTQAYNADHDIGVITLDRPMGSIAGYRGFGYNTDCGWFLGGSWTRYMYPADAPYNGLVMYTDTGDYDGCELVGNEVFVDKPGTGGESGGGAVRNSNGIVYAVRSNSYGIWDLDAYDTRLTSGKFDDINDRIQSITAPGQDWRPLFLRLSEPSEVSNTYLHGGEYVMYNDGDEGTPAGPATVSAYLSPDPNITTGDILLGTWSEDAVPTVRGGFSSRDVPVLPLPALASGTYYVGVHVTIPGDSNTSNNMTLGEEATELVITCEPMTKPTLYAPDADETCLDGSVAVLFDWDSFQSADLYQLRLMTQCGGTPIGTFSTTGSSLTLDESYFFPGGEYVWRVRARGGCGSWGPWSDCRRFTTRDESLPPPTYMLSPPDGETCLDTLVTLRFSRAPRAAETQVQWGTSCGVGSMAITSGLDLNVGFLDRNTTYHWRARCRGVCGEEWGPWGPCRTFTTAPSLPPQPIPVGPYEGFCHIGDVTADWRSVPGASKYRVRLYSGTHSASSVPDTSFTTPDTTWTFTGLEPGESYTWSVEAYAACGNWGPGAGRSLRIAPLAPAPPENLEPGTTASCAQSTVSLDWAEPFGATAYRVRLGTICGTLPFAAILDTVVAAPPVLVSGLPEDEYAWQVRVDEDCAQGGAWTPCVRFTVYASEPTLADFTVTADQPEGAWLTEHDLEFSWSATPVSGCPVTTVKSLVDTTAISPVTGARVVDQVLNPFPISLPDGTNHYVHVQGHDAMGRAARVLAHLGPFLIDTVDPFGSFQVPAGGERWVYEDIETIEFTLGDLTSGLASVELFWSENDGDDFWFVDSLPPLSTSYDWEVARGNTRDQARLRLRLTDTAGNTRNVVSPAFGIAPRVVGVGDPGVTAFRLLPARPNPFHAATRVEFTTTETGAVTLTVFDAVGRRVRSLLDRVIPGGGRHEETWDGRDDGGRVLPAGIYYLALRGQGLTETRKVVRIR